MHTSRPIPAPLQNKRRRWAAGRRQGSRDNRRKSEGLRQQQRTASRGRLPPETTRAHTSKSIPRETMEMMKTAARLVARFSFRYPDPVFAAGPATNSSTALAPATADTRGRVRPPTGFVRAAPTASVAPRRMKSIGLSGVRGPSPSSSETKSGVQSASTMTGRQGRRNVSAAARNAQAAAC